VQEDTLLLTTEERDRLKVLHEVLQGHMTQRCAAKQLKLSTRQVRRLLRRLKRKGDRAVVHALRGRPSNRKIAEKTEQRAVALVRRKYHDFGPTLASEYLAKDDGIGVSRETLPGWMMEAGIWRSRRQRIEEVHLWRQRRSCFGELLQWDMLWAYLTRYGRPLEIYADLDTVFAVSKGEAARAAREGWAEAPKTQFGRGLQEPANATDAHRPLRAEHDLAAILCEVQPRIVTNDYHDSCDSGTAI
jgi:transposase